MTPSDCSDCTLFQFLAAWSWTSGPFWAFLVINIIWISKVLRSYNDSKSNKNGFKNETTQWLRPYLKTKSQLIICFILHLIILTTQLVEGYWILQIWWRWTREFWNWKLKNYEWSKQFYQFIMVAALGLLLPVLFLAGFFLVMATVLCLCEFREWEFGEEVAGTPEGSTKTTNDKE